MIYLEQAGTEWIVAYQAPTGKEIREFSSIDLACDFLEDDLSLSSDEVDLAIIQLDYSKHAIALFDKNVFSHTLAE